MESSINQFEREELGITSLCQELALQNGFEPSNYLNIIKTIEAYESYRNSLKVIKIKFTDDEYGKEAKKLGLPKYAYKDDAGFDLPTILPSAEQANGIKIYPGDRIILNTGLKIEFPKGYFGRIIHRSSTEKKFRLRIIEGIIDAGYRGPILVQVHNANSFPLDIAHGQKLGQLVLCHTCNFKLEEVHELSPSERSANGFGSSGK